MYESIKAWINIPLTIRPFLKRSGTGQKTYGDNIDTKCYASGKVTTVTDDKGVEVVSKIQLYVDGKTEIGSNDAVIFAGKEYNILSIALFFGPKGNIDLKVVYI